MTVIGNLQVLVTSDTSPLVRAMKSAKKAATDFGNVAGRKLTGALTNLRRSLTSGTAALVGFGSAAAGIGLSVKLAADLETTALQFEVMTGSAKKGKKVLQDIKKFAASTPFQFPDLANAGKALLAFGVSSDNVLDKMKVLGDISAISGARISELTSIFGKMKSSGIASLGDINQFGDRRIPIFKTLQKQLSMSGDELKKFISAGRLGFGEVEKALISMTTEGGKFQNGMARLADTAAGKLSTLSDNIRDVMTKIGGAFIENFNLKNMTDNLTTFAQVFSKEVVPPITEAVKGLVFITDKIGKVTSGASGSFLGLDVSESVGKIARTREQVAGGTNTSQFRLNSKDQRERGFLLSSQLELIRNKKGFQKGPVENADALRESLLPANVEKKRAAKIADQAFVARIKSLGSQFASGASTANKLMQVARQSAITRQGNLEGAFANARMGAKAQFGIAQGGNFLGRLLGKGSNLAADGLGALGSGGTERQRVGFASNVGISASSAEGQRLREQSMLGAQDQSQQRQENRDKERNGLLAKIANAVVGGGEGNPLAVPNPASNGVL